MYIGPWQEYKLAQVIKVKNDIYEGKPYRLSTQALEKHNSIQNATHKSHVSTPSTRSFSSEPVQKPYPTFDIDSYYKQWRKVESIISKADENNKKPPLPPRQDIRRRTGKTIQEKRVNKMRVIYGIEKKNELKLPSIPNSPKPDSPKVMESPKASTVENARIELKSFGNPIKFNDKLGKNENIFQKHLVPFSEESKAKNELKAVISRAEKIEEEKKIKNELKVADCRDEKNEEILDDTENIEEISKINDATKYCCLNPQLGLDVIEESINQEGIDGLLQWVDNLPDEISGSPMINSKGFIL